MVAGVGVAGDVGSPLVLRGIGVTGSDVLVLQRFELLLSAEFVGLGLGQLDDVRNRSSAYHDEIWSRSKSKSRFQSRSVSVVWQRCSDEEYGEVKPIRSVTCPRKA